MHQGAEAGRKRRPVLQGLELTRRGRSVVRDMRARVRRGDAEIREQERHGFGRHRGPAIRVDREVPGHDPLPGARGLDQPFGQRRAFAGRHHPADGVAAEDVQDHVQVEVGPLGRPQERGEVPAPQLVGPRGQ